MRHQRHIHILTDTLFLIMETPEQAMQDKLSSERKIRRTLQRQLQERENEIETLKAENRISQQEYQQALQKLYADQESNEKLISEMAKRYSTLDYDQMDEFYRLGKQHQSTLIIKKIIESIKLRTK